MSKTSRTGKAAEELTQTDLEILSSDEVAFTAQIIEDLHDKWAPHSGQLKAGKALFVDDIRNIFIQCGRKWGKSEFCVYSLFRWALLNPGSACYYLAPLQKQAKEIVWASRRLQNFIPNKYIKKIDNTELRITLINDSFIKLDGSDNHESYRGITPDFVVYDEFKDFHPLFHEGMAPNLAVKDAPLIIIGTPPSRECQYTVLAEEFKERDDCYHTQMSSHTNPHISKEWLDREKKKLLKRGEQDVWQREYMAEFVRGGAASIFPMYDPEIYMDRHSKIMTKIGRKPSKMQWFVTCDPGSATVFAALIGCYNPYTKEMFILDEIYEKNTMNTSVRQIYPRLDYKMMELYPNSSIHDDWIKTYDEAATWFSVEVMNQYGVYFAPTAKNFNRKEEGLSLIKDQMIHNLVYISDRCQYLSWELLNYVKTEKGDIPKKDDHLIDCWRYSNASYNYSMVEVLERIKKENDTARRMVKIEDDIDDLLKEDDWTYNIMPDWEI